MNDKVTEYINEAPREQKQIMETIRKIIHDFVPNVDEEIKWSRPVFSAKKDFAYFKTAKAHVTMGFFNFQNLYDPNNKLEGTGKDMRHIKLKTMNDIERDQLKEWLTTAAK